MAETEEEEKERLLIELAFCYEFGRSKETKGGECDYGCNGGNLVEAIAQEISTGSFS
jgi:hypothetical protein